MLNVKVSNINGHNNEPVTNQFVIQTIDGDYFQSYDSVIAYRPKKGKIQLDKQYWDYSTTTGKYRNIFLGEKRKETERKIKDGIYELVNLN